MPVIGLFRAVMAQTRSARHYQEQAAQLRAMAAKEPDGSSIRERLLELAAQYDRLAERAEADRK